MLKCVCVSNSFRKHSDSARVATMDEMLYILLINICLYFKEKMSL